MEATQKTGSLTSQGTQGNEDPCNFMIQIEILAKWAQLVEPKTKEEVTGQAKEMPEEQMLLLETKGLAETYLPLKNTIDNGVREALKKSDRASKKERIKTLWATHKRRERIARIILRLWRQENNRSTSSHA
ncbi:hypothetical protein RND71_026234 [Anisodus tanguticus]|uniref:Uncharacterized protein n=1 Tax=Anisodus tanguticus TaxID=243964 RepID=A0AAE1VB45_9SOLA|nr:hypothetical protein RND71_026234 [Anisodus tanguticus]